MHGIDVAAVGLAEYGKPGNYFARQISRWSEQYRASETQSIPAMDALIERLPARCPADDGVVALVHGDFRIDNLMFHPEQPRIIAVVDWELSTLGHPLADLGYFCMALRLPRNPALPGLAGLDRAVLGIPDEATILRRYTELTGRPMPRGLAVRAGLQFFPAGRDRPGRGQARRARQCIEREGRAGRPDDGAAGANRIAHAGLS